jgi:hypothetical protein
LPDAESRNAVAHVSGACRRSHRALRRDAVLGNSEQQRENEAPDEPERGDMTHSSLHERFSS